MVHLFTHDSQLPSPFLKDMDDLDFLFDDAPDIWQRGVTVWGAAWDVWDRLCCQAMSIDEYRTGAETRDLDCLKGPRGLRRNGAVRPEVAHHI